MKKSIWIFSLILPVCLVSCRESKEKMFERAAREQTAKCPRTINEFTRLDSVVYLSGKNINQYYYTLTGAADDAGSIRENESEMKQALKNEVINSMDLKEYKDFHTTFEYIYHSQKDQSVLWKIQLTPQAYK